MIQHVLRKHGKQWRCPICRVIGNAALFDRIACGSPRATVAGEVKPCDYRREYKIVPRDLLACGCEQIGLYRCDFFHEIVTRKPASGELGEVLQVLEADFNGRDCATCQVVRDPETRQASNAVRLVPSRRNLIYHCYASRANDGWRDNLAELVARWQVFNGRRIVAIACDENTHRFADVRRQLPEDCDAIEFRNNPRLREVATFRQLLDRVASTNHWEATFYAHTKANTTAVGGPGAWYWSVAMYRHLLDQPHVVGDLLRSHAFVGACKMIWPHDHRPPYPTGLNVGNWMFAGTFFWFRHDAIFANDRWRQIADDRYGAEAWPSTVCPWEGEGATIYQPWPADELGVNPYDIESHKRTKRLEP